MGRPGMAPEFQAERAVNPVPRRLAGVSEARRRIGFEATIPLEAGMAELVDWWAGQRAPAALEAAE
jgi:UDP-glucose 4-epimerase